MSASAPARPPLARGTEEEELRKGLARQLRAGNLIGAHWSVQVLDDGSLIAHNCFSHQDYVIDFHPLDTKETP